MNQKKQKIITYLLDSQGTYLTSQYLATELSVSDRTIRTYLKDIKNIVEDNGGEIKSKTGHGYKLSIKDEALFNQYLNKQQVKGIDCANLSTFPEVEDRQNYILNKLLLEDAVLNAEELSEQLFISVSSINKDINEIKERLKPYHLSIQSKPVIGFWVEGLEMEKRHFIMDTFFGKNYNNPLKDYMGNNSLLKEISFEELTIIILDEAREEKLKISDIIIQNLVLHLSLAMKRISEGFELKEIDIEINDTNKKELKVAKNILYRVEKELEIVFPKEEIHYLTLHLMAKSNQQSSRVHDDLSDNLLTAIEQISEEIDLQLIEDYQLYNGLLEHLKPMLIRLQKGIVLRNPLIDTIKKQYPEYFELTKKNMSQMKILADFEVSDDEWAYLSLHIMAAIEKAKNNRKLKVLIICATGYGSAQLLRNRVINEFGSQINVIDVMGYYELNEASLQNIDLIISSINLSSVVFKIPVLHVSVFLNDEDVSLIKQKIKKINGYNSTKTDNRQSDKKAKKRTYIKNILKNEHFVVYQEQTTKEFVIQDLLQKLSLNESEDFVIKMTHQIQQRESMGQFIFSESIAVPHPAIPVGLSTKVAVGIIPNGLEWDEQKNVTFVFLLSPSYIENKEITILTKGIISLVDNLDSQQKILSQVTFDNFSRVFIDLI